MHRTITCEIRPDPLPSLPKEMECELQYIGFCAQTLVAAVIVW